MPTPRIYTDQPLIPNQEVELEAGPSRHLIRVLRLEAGAGIRLFNGDGFDYGATLLNSEHRAAQVLIQSASGPEPPPPLEIHLGIGISKGDRMDFVIQKSVELGVNGICPLFCARSVVQLKGERLAKKINHWRNVAIAACEQSGRRRIPRIRTPMRLESWVSDATEMRLMLNPQAQQSLAALAPPAEGVVTLLIGPEGGFAEGEITFAAANGFQGIRLGPRVLRTETAPLAAIAAVQALWGDLR